MLSDAITLCHCAACYCCHLIVAFQLFIFPDAITPCHTATAAMMLLPLTLHLCVSDATAVGACFLLLLLLKMLLNLS